MIKNWYLLALINKLFNEKSLINTIIKNKKMIN